MRHEHPSIEAVEIEIASGARRLAFSRPIEASYHQESTGERVRLFLVCSAVAICLYDAFLISDWLMLRDMFGTMVLYRLAVFTPMMGLCMIVVWRGASAMLRESLGVFATFLAILLPMSAMLASHSTYRLNYQFGSLLIMVFATVIQRLPFRFALCSLTCVLTVQVVTTRLSDALDADTYAANCLFFGAAAALLLLASYFLERSDRLSYLFSLRARILHLKLAELACTDPLTQLFNRRHLGDVLAGLWKDARTEPTPVAMVLLDIDHFKAFNDSLGHLKGDDCLRWVSARIAALAAAAGGLAFRFGGEEILIVLPGRSEEAARGVAETMRAAIQAEAIGHPVLGPGAVVTASLGVAGAMAPDAEADCLIAAADAGLYAAKRAGRNRVSVAGDDTSRSGLPIRRFQPPLFESSAA